MTDFTADHFAPFELPPEAVQWLLDLWHVIQVLDDVADDDPVLRPDLDRAILASLVGMPGNPFFQQHHSVLLPVVAGLIAKWKAADDAELSGQADERSFMWRAGYYDVILAVIMCAHNAGTAMRVAKHVMHLYGETFAEYRKEFPCPTP
jgi:hypothetical protein